MRSRYPYPPEGESVGCLEPTTVENVDGTVLSARSTDKGTWLSKPQVLDEVDPIRDHICPRRHQLQAETVPAGTRAALPGLERDHEGPAGSIKRRERSVLTPFFVVLLDSAPDPELTLQYPRPRVSLS